MKTISKALFLILKTILALAILCGFIILIGYFYSQYLCKQITEITLLEWQQLANLTYGAFGIVLGYLYFISKITIDSNNAKKERIRNRLVYIREELIQADKLIEQIFNFHIKDKDELYKIRLEIDRRFMLLTNNYLENNDDLIGFSDKELASIVAVYSFVNNSNIISEIEFNLLYRSARSTERLKYLDVFYEATTMCIQKLEK